MRLQITPGRGERVLSEVVPLALKYEKQLLDALYIDEQKVLHKAIQKLQARARVLNST